METTRWVHGTGHSGFGFFHFRLSCDDRFQLLTEPLPKQLGDWGVGVRCILLGHFGMHMDGLAS